MLIICSIILLVSVLATYYCIKEHSDRTIYTYKIPLTDFYVQLEKINDKETKMSFSKNNVFGSDYIRFKSDNRFNDIHGYYFHGNVIKVIGREPLIEVASKDFVIKEFSAVPPKAVGQYPHYTDSAFIKEPCLCFNLNEESNGFIVHDGNNNVVFAVGTINDNELEAQKAIILCIALIAISLIISWYFIRRIKY